MNCKVFFKKLEQAGWKEIDLKNDFDYQFRTAPEGVKDNSKQIIEAYRLMTPEQQKEFILRRMAEVEKEMKLIKNKPRVRVHLPEDERNVEFLTEGEITNDSNHKCYALPSDKEPDLVHFKECGFIKHVVFLKIENDEVVNWFVHFAITSSLEQRQSVYDFLSSIKK